MIKLSSKEVAKAKEIASKSTNKSEVPKKEPVKAPVSTSKPSSNVDTTLVKEQIKATLAAATATEKAVNNPKLDKIIELLVQQVNNVPPIQQTNPNKKLIINRDSTGLIESIDIINRELN